MGFELSHIDHIQLCIPHGSEEMAKIFYLTILPFQEIEKPEALKATGGFWCQSGSIVLHIGVEDGKEVKSKRHPAFVVKDLKSACAYLREKGVKIYEETPIPGVNRFSIRDPFGNRIELLEYRNGR